MARFAQLIVISLSLVASVAQADFVYDATADYSTANNPTGVWQYGKMASNLTGGFILSNYNNGSASLNSWALSTDPDYDGNILPGVFKNLSAAEINIADSHFEADELVLHAGVGFASIVRFVVPFTSSYSIDALFENRTTNIGTRVDILSDNISIFPGAVTPTSLGGGTAYTSPTLALIAGSTIDFVVNTRLDNSFNSTSTQLNARITAVPEIGSIFMGLIAIVGCVGIGFATKASKAAAVKTESTSEVL